MSDLEPRKPVGEPIRLRDPKSSGNRRAGSSESVVLCGALLAVGVAIGIYALRKAAQDEPAPAPVAVEEESAAPAPKAESVAPRRTRPAPRAEQTTAASPKVEAPAAAHAPAVVYHTEAEKKAVDPEKGFDTGEAFDNPPSPGRYGQRSSGYAGRPATGSETMRPNQPDPSFGPEQPAEQPKAKAKGRRRP